MKFPKIKLILLSCTLAFATACGDSDSGTASSEQSSGDASSSLTDDGNDWRAYCLDVINNYRAT